jgi:tetratricopeptide (TPR) repeat protein
MIGVMLTKRREYAEAEALLRPALEEAEVALGRLDAATIQLAFALGSVFETRAVHGGESAQAMATLRADAARLYRRVIDDEDQLGIVSFSGLHARFDLVQQALQMENFEEAAALAGDTLSLTEDRLGPDHPMVSDSARRLATALYGLGRPREAAPHMIRAVSIQRRRQADSIMTLVSMADSLHVLDAAGEWAVALEYAQFLVQRFGADTAHGQFSIECQIWLPYLMTRLGRPDEAKPLLDVQMAAEAEMDDLRRARLHYAQGVWCKEMGEADQARLHFETALAMCGDELHHWPPRAVVRDAIASLEVLDAE